MKKRMVSLALALATALGFVMPAGAAEYPQTFNGDVLLAVNSALATDTLVEGSFEVDSGAAASLLALKEEGDIYDVWTDPETGAELTVLAPALEMPEPVSGEEHDPEKPLSSIQTMAADYQVGDPLTFQNLDGQLNSADTDEDENMVCIHVGTHCTVWTSHSDPEAIRLSEEQGAAIAAYFDAHYTAMVEAFGEPHDADGDGKVAIMCYDLSDQYDPTATGSFSGSYTAGLFYGGDMIDTNGYVNGVWYGNNSYINGLDCIHIDTYPTMGSYAQSPLSNISRSYSTLFHEFQHMINYSHQVKNGRDGYVTHMETYLNEAFAMAAEHLICGEESTRMRVDYFNSDYYSEKYVRGTALTYWRGNLSAYSNSFLFGQYIRTRYGQLKGNDGSTLYKTVLESRTEENETDTLGIITDLLETTKEELILDFWAAVYCKAPSGVYGFAGETWADAIEPVVESGFGNTAGIYNGGVKYYVLGEEGCTVAASQDVTLLSLSLADDSEEVQILCREEAGQTTVHLEAWGSARTAAVVLYSDDGRMMGLEWLSLTNGRLSYLVDTLGLRLQLLMLGENNFPLCKALSR